MREAVIVSTARTPIGKAYRGAFNDTTAPALAGHAIANAVSRAGIDPAEIDDVVLGAALQQGTTHMNIARTAALRAGLPVTVAGLDLTRVLDLLHRDKKRDAGGLRMVLLEDLEAPTLLHVDRADVEMGLTAIGF